MATTSRPSSSPAQRPLRCDAERNRQRIVEAAREVFAARGLCATLDDVAQHAGVGVGTVYRRFPTKEALVEVAFESRVEEVAELAETARSAPSAWEGLTLFLRRCADLQAEDRGLRDVALSAGYGSRHLARIQERVLPSIADVITRAQAEGSLRGDVTTLDLPLIFYMVSQVAHHGSGSRPDLYRRYLELLIDGLRGPSAACALGRPPTDEDIADFAQQMTSNRRRHGASGSSASPISPASTASRVVRTPNSAA
jgi:AcrR family transcriptional regulator